jgi:hypothetical protein
MHVIVEVTETDGFVRDFRTTWRRRWSSRRWPPTSLVHARSRCHRDACWRRIASRTVHRGWRVGNRHVVEERCHRDTRHLAESRSSFRLAELGLGTWVPTRHITIKSESGSEQVVVDISFMSSPKIITGAKCHHATRRAPNLPLPGALTVRGRSEQPKGGITLVVYLFGGEIRS